MRKMGRKEGIMGRAPCCNKGEVKKGAWTPEEDKILVDYITRNGHGTWRSFPKLADLQRCGKSCRLRWTNYLRPDIKRGHFSYEEEQTIFQLHSLHGNKWATIASRLPGRTDNEIKNYWNTRLKKRMSQTNSPSTSTDSKSKSPSTRHMADWENARVETNTRLSIDPMIPIISNNNNFVHKWGSRAEEAFQNPCNFNSVTKIESDSVVTVQAFTSTSESCDHSVKERVQFKEEAEETTNASDSQNSYEAENSSDLTLDLLLDFPDGEYLEYV